MFVSEDIWSLLSTEHQDDDMEDRLGILQADLEQFAYAASHDLKAPLRGIGNVSDWLEEDLAGALASLGAHVERR